MDHPTRKSIFISRRLQPESVFMQQLTAEGFKVYDESLVNFQALAFDLKESPNWLFFYSRHAVRFFFNQLQDTDWLQGIKLAAIGSGTADELRKFRPRVDFIGTGEPEVVAAAFGKIAEGKRVLFPRARQSRRSIQLLLGQRIQSADLIVYDNLQRTDLDLPVCQVLVFTSPMNAEAYFQVYDLQAGQQVFAIGQVTGKCLRQLGVQEVKVAAQPSEESLAEVILQSVL